VLRQTARLMHEPHVPFQCQVAVWQQTKRAYTSPGQGRPPKRPNRPCAMITCEDSAHRFGPTAAGKQSRPGQSADCIQRSSLPTANRPRVQRTSQAQRERGGDGRHERRGVGRALQRRPAARRPPRAPPPPRPPAAAAGSSSAARPAPPAETGCCHKSLAEANAGHSKFEGFLVNRCPKRLVNVSAAKSWRRLSYQEGVSAQASVDPKLPSLPSACAPAGRQERRRARRRCRQAALLAAGAPA